MCTVATFYEHMGIKKHIVKILCSSDDTIVQCSLRENNISDDGVKVLVEGTLRIKCTSLTTLKYVTPSTTLK